VNRYSITRQVKAASGVNVNNSVIAGIIVGGVALAAAGALAVNSGYNPFQKYATVVSVEQAFDTTQTPRVVCGDEETLAQAQAQAQAQATSPAEGAGATTPPPEPQAPEVSPEKAPADAKKGEQDAQRCLTVFDTASVEAGFDVTYELDGVQKVVRMDHDPGKRIPVENGELVLTPS
jgi:uncharacterized protein YcfJ